MVIKVVIAVERGDCEVENALNEYGARFSVSRVNIGLSESTHLIALSEDSIDRIENLMNYLRRRGLKVGIAGRSTIWVRGPSCSACRTMAGLDIVINGSKPVEGKAIYNAWIPNRGKIRELIIKLKRSGLSFKLLSIDEVSRIELTEKQFEVLSLAYRRGLFDPRRRTSVLELSRELGVSPSTFSEVLRKAIKKVLFNYFNELP